MRIDPGQFARFVDSHTPGTDARTARPPKDSSGSNSVSNADQAQPAQQQSASNSPKNTQPIQSIEDQVEVRVQYDKQMDMTMIYQFLDKQSGSLVLQVPSQQVLSVAHAIDTQLQQDISKQTQSDPTSAVSEAEKANGNQL